jgi:glutamate dehydrogenase
MTQPIDELKDRIIQQAVDIGRQKLSASQQVLAERLIRASYANVAPEDVLKRDPETLFGGAAALLDFMGERTPGAPKLRVYLPRYENAGWESEHGVIEIVNDDMPFLVDSLSAALQKREIDIHLLVHPILSVSRGAAGRLTDIAENKGGKDHTLESVMHIEIDRLAAATDPAKLAEDLLAVFADVRSAVEDWQPMKKAALAAIETLKTAQVPEAAGDVAETREFLNWLCDDNFTFLGMRDYDFAPGTDRVGVQPDSCLGLLRDVSLGLFDSDSHGQKAGPEVEAFLRPQLLVLTKGDRLSTVHRSVQLDVIGIKRFDKSGKVVGMLAIAGLYGHAAYNMSALDIPYLRQKVSKIVARAGFSPTSHDGKSLLAILENYPRDELVQANDDLLFNISLGILRLQGRQQVALFLRPDDLGRFVSALVFVPRDRYDTKLRQRWSDVLEDAFGGTVVTWFAQVAENPLARLHFVVRKKDKALKSPNIDDLEKRLADAARSWADRLREALLEAHGEEKGLALYRRWGDLFPLSYRELESPRAALADIDQLANLGGKVGVHLHRPLMAPETEVRFKLYHKTLPVALSDVLPLFEHMGFRVISENPHELRRDASDIVWIHDFTMATLDGTRLNVEALRHRFEDAFLALWNGDAEDDGFNKLLVGADLTWRQIAILRAYAKYLRQAGSTFSGAYVERSVVSNPAIAKLLVTLFERRFDPAGSGKDEDILAAIDKALDAVTSADEDRILRRFLNLIDSTLRTNYFQKTAEGGPKSYVSFKLDSLKVQGLPLPRPMVEVFVYSPRMEGIHLRGGKVARGGIRWSDRPEDFRTEILGLIKAQMVKNAVIVPVGSKGGFVVKRPPATGGREALQQEGIACYQTLMRGLLDITDNLSGGDVVPPKDVVRRDGDDPYLVVAADKGTATFSDIANGVSAEYGHWLGDAFASGGSVGYDHKAMGITARGGWVSVERHFREMGIDCQKEDFTVVGIGDMSGDVFGNGMLRSRHTRLLAAFDHRHIFIDPDPDAEKSFVERERMFALPRSSWADYDKSLISAGGGIYPRDAKTISLSPEACSALGVPADPLTPAELIRHLICAEVDLLWFGGIGTYVKSEGETHAEVGDRANESLRVDGNNLRCKVIGEGANLGVTQLGRVEAALNGVRLNTDAIDNSAGVDCSDHEVNIKILVNDAVANGDMTLKQRNELLAKMTDDVGLLVLRDNYLQTQAISIFQSQAMNLAEQQMRFMHMLEDAGRLNRTVEFLPSDDELKRRLHGGTALTRPELAVLLAYSKMWLYDAVLSSDLPDDPVLVDDLVRYFPTELRKKEWRPRMDRHRLKREIIATSAVNSMVNRIGGSFVFRMMERFGCTPEEVVRAYLVTRDAFALREVWEAIEALDGQVPAEVQITMLNEGNRLIDRGVAWILTHAPRPIDMGKLKTMLAPAIDLLRNHRDRFMAPDALALFEFRADEYINAGMPEDLAHKVAGMILLVAAGDIATIAIRIGSTVERVAQFYFRVSARFGLGWLRATADNLPDSGPWQRMAIDAVIDDLYVHQGQLTANIVQNSGAMAPEEALAVWSEQRKQAVTRVERLLGEMRTIGSVDLATLVVAGNHLRALAQAQTI